MSAHQTADVGSGAVPVQRRAPRPILRMLAQRIPLGLLTIVIVTVIVFASTQLLPGNAARAVLGRDATDQQVADLEHQMGLDQAMVVQYWNWVSGLLHGDFGTSLVNGQSVSSMVGPRVVNSFTLMVLAGLIGTVIGVLLGLYAGIRQGSVLDHLLSTASLAVVSLPEFVVAILVTLTFSTSVFHWFPAVSTIPSGTRPWEDPSLLVLPTIVLVIMIVPYLFRMMRAATIEALGTEYVEMARLNGIRESRVLRAHALPNALAPVIQAIGLNLLYLAGGIVVVETVFNYPGIGQGLYNDVLNTDIPAIQFSVTFLTVFYVVVNVATDALVLVATPRKRWPR